MALKQQIGRIIIHYDENGVVASMQIEQSRRVTQDFGDGAETMKRNIVTNIAKKHMSAATLTTLGPFVAALKANAIAEQQRPPDTP